MGSHRYFDIDFVLVVDIADSDLGGQCCREENVGPDYCEETQTQEMLASLQKLVLHCDRKDAT